MESQSSDDEGEKSEASTFCLCEVQSEEKERVSWLVDCNHLGRLDLAARHLLYPLLLYHGRDQQVSGHTDLVALTAGRPVWQSFAIR